MTRLASEDTWALPLKELSALALRRLPSRARELIAVSDDDYTVVSAKLSDDDEPAQAVSHPLAEQLPHTVTDATEGSEFEGVACDSGGLVFVLQEGPARVLVLSPDFRALRQTIQLRVSPDEPGFGAEWHDEPNKRGEGLLLMRNGHLLVVKQRKPVRFIEFGPASEPGGIESQSLLGPDRRFDLPQGEQADFDVLASWPLHDDCRDRFESINDLAVGDDGRLYVLSSKSRRIGRVEPHVGIDEDSVRLSDEWDLPERLPGGGKGKPEGLTILDGLRPLVSIDTKKSGDNLVRLERITAE
jgi:hypothetical protein